jgi:poly-gamma-glutamate synthesis protein (capsule biosynthesis protein)
MKKTDKAFAGTFGVLIMGARLFQTGIESFIPALILISLITAGCSEPAPEPPEKPAESARKASVDAPEKETSEEKQQDASPEASPSPASPAEAGMDPGASGAVFEKRDRPVIRLAAAGDVMLQRRCNRSARQKSRGDENNHGYDGLFPGLSRALDDADMAIANIEFPVFDRKMREQSMVFHGTTPVLSALKKAGFTVLNAANNHSFDHGRKSVASTLKECKKARIPCIGMGENKSRAEAPHIIEIKGVRLAVIGYTSLFNINLNSDDPDAPRVNGCSNSMKELKKQVEEAAGAADGVIVSLHWGEEYRLAPTRYQAAHARELAEAGACLILGHHPHVLQRIELITTKSGRVALAAYSLGNLLSNQGGYSYARHTRLGAILKADLTLTGRGVEVAAWDTLTSWTHNKDTRIDGKMIEDVHVQVSQHMIQEFEELLAAASEDTEKSPLLKKIEFYRGRIEAAEKILLNPRGNLEKDKLAKQTKKQEI